MKNRIYATADEKFSMTTMLYANASDKLFYNEDAKTEPVKNADLNELFTKGVTVTKSGVVYKPIALKTNDLIAYDGTSAVTFEAE